jgi:general secretion pathway protein K
VRRTIHSRQAKQEGVAIITALLLTTLAIGVVTSLFWHQQVQVRSIENQRLQLQKQWILRGALDWARLILREDGKFTSVDDLTEPWAVPLADTRLDSYVTPDAMGADVANALLSGSIQDAQACLNLSTLASHGVINPVDVAAFEKLLGALQQDTSLARAAAQQIALTQSHADSKPGTPRPIAFIQIDDLLSVPGYTPSVVAALRNHIIFLPRATPVNINTASAEVIAARLPQLSSSDVSSLVARRRTASFRDLHEVATYLPGTPDPDPALISVGTHYFLVNGHIAIQQAALQVQGLVERSGSATYLLWLREA